jgi:hypothetical protein
MWIAIYSDHSLLVNRVGSHRLVRVLLVSQCRSFKSKEAHHLVGLLYSTSQLLTYLSLPNQQLPDLDVPDGVEAG